MLQGARDKKSTYSLTPEVPVQEKLIYSNKNQTVINSGMVGEELTAKEDGEIF